MGISVVIPYYNSSDIIERTLESVKNQTYLPKEVIIIDDCSDTIHSLDFITKKDFFYPFELIIIKHKENLGASAARNTGIKASKQDYIAFLDADDCWIEKKLEIQIGLIGNFDLLFCNYCESKSDINEIKLNNAKTIKPVNYFQILKKNLSPVTLLVKRKSIIMFDARFRRCDDFKMSMEALAEGRSLGYLDLDVSYGFKKSIGGGGLTKSLSKMSLSFLKACIYIIYERPKMFFTVLPFIFFEIIKFPIRCLKVYFLR